MSLRFLAKVTFKKGAAHKNEKSINAHRKTHTQKHQHSKTAGFLNSTQANFHSKNLKLFFGCQIQARAGFLFYFGKTPVQFQGQKFHQLGTKDYIYIYIYIYNSGYP